MLKKLFLASFFIFTGYLAIIGEFGEPTQLVVIFLPILLVTILILIPLATLFIFVPLYAKIYNLDNDTAQVKACEIHIKRRFFYKVCRFLMSSPAENMAWKKGDPNDRWKTKLNPTGL